MTNENLIVGMCWYSEDQWNRLNEIAADPLALDDSYEEWRKSAEKAINELRANGVAIKKVLVDMEEMLRWANEKGRPLNSEARSEYVAFILSQKSKS
jgi:hypothetical protein